MSYLHSRSLYSLWDTEPLLSYMSKCRFYFAANVAPFEKAKALSRLGSMVQNHRLNVVASTLLSPTTSDFDQGKFSKFLLKGTSKPNKLSQDHTAPA